MTSSQRVVVGNDVCIGCNAIIPPAVRRVGNGAVIGAGSIVTKDVPDFAVVAGNPAAIIKYRLTEEVQQSIKASTEFHRGSRDDCTRASEAEDPRLLAGRSRSC